MNQSSQTKLKGIWGWAAGRLGIHPWGQILIILLLAQAWFIWGMHNDLSEIKGALRSMPVSISQDLLAQAKDDVSARNLTRALQAANSAQELLVRSTTKRVPASANDFARMAADLDLLDETPALKESVGGTRVVLADYRSALAPQPNLRGTRAPIEGSTSLTAEAATVDRSNLPGSVLVAPPGSSFEFLTAPFIRRLSNAPRVVGVGFINATQTLDGFRWDGVAFVNALIRYDGGEIELNNTRFINCSFQMSEGPRSAKVATYVTLEQSYLKIGPND